MTYIWIWVGIIAVSLIVEFITMEMVSLWTAVGGFISLILSALDVKFEIQLVVFFAISIVLVLTLRKVSLKYLIKKNDLKVGNDRIIGNHYRLLTKITNETSGTIKVGDITWSAISVNGNEIAENTIVEIVEIRGNKLIVKEKEKI